MAEPEKHMNETEQSQTPENENAPSPEEQEQSPALEAEQTGAPLNPETAAEAYQDNTQNLQAELDQTKDQLMRALAEAENTRRRARQEREDAGKFAIAGFAREMLNVADNLRRALDAVPEDLVDSDVRIKNLLEGIEATEREMLKTFETNGVKKLEPLDEPFDPNFHEVMFETPDTGKPAGTIIQVIEVGYVLNERLLRPARVGVAKDDGSAPPAENPTEPGDTIDTEV